ncbi:MAG: twin-arginine translocase TatA/TatE family subunit [Defluviicoccus sp.]|nr:twin-arginine translocase TatA/TatE family subunit [Defluviicoccus sp.]MDE0383498.1 twin-arginine translocase TatA/TatE family subunit [Defluviicoccus sp.]
MGSFSIWHWLVVLVVVLVLFGGGGKLSRLMGDAARGINAFKKGLKDTDPAGTVSAEAKDPAKEIPAEARERDETAKS